jgi:hypothetical protein
MSRGVTEKKKQKKYAKICVYQKKDVILHRGFVRALERVGVLCAHQGACN